MIDKCLRMALESPGQMEMYLELHTGKEIFEHIKAALDEIERLRGALAWIHNNTEEDAIKHPSYEALAAGIYGIAKGGLDGTFVDDMNAAEVYDELYPRAST